MKAKTKWKIDIKLHAVVSSYVLMDESCQAGKKTIGQQGGLIKNINKTSDRYTKFNLR